MGFIILIIIVIGLAMLFNKLELDGYAFSSSCLAAVLSVLFLVISSDINDDRKFIKEHYNDLNIMLTNKIISSKGISDALEVNNKIECWRDLKSNWFLGTHYSEEFGKPLLNLPDFYSVDSLKVINK